MGVDVNDGEKRTHTFLQEMLVTKKRKVDIEGVLARKKAEKGRYEERVSTMKKDIKKKVQRLKATEVMVDNLTHEIAALEEE